MTARFPLRSTASLQMGLPLVSETPCRRISILNKEPAVSACERGSSARPGRCRHILLGPIRCAMTARFPSLACSPQMGLPRQWALHPANQQFHTNGNVDQPQWAARNVFIGEPDEILRHMLPRSRPVMSAPPALAIMVYPL
jgi:hypothetical protein